ncbi:MAG: Trehalose transport system permease protein SugB [Anaerolineae bacterium]|nr:Trehalose transport system permease protein SugB [Anaerolineae bacterium]
MLTKTKRTHLLQRVLLYLAVLVIIIWTTAPYLWLIISSLSYRIDLLQVPLHWIPPRITLDNYYELFVSGGQTNANATLFLQALRNSGIITFSATFICLVLGVLAAYALARLKFPGSGVYLALMMTVQMVPPVAIVIPLYVILRNFNMLDTRYGLVLVYLSFILPLVVWLMRSYFAAIPSELEDAARIDGCSRLGALMRVILPLSGPGLVSVAVFAFIAAWNEYLYAFILTTVDAKTLPVLIGEFSTKLGLEYLRIAAAGVLASLPPVILALIFQRFIIRGLTAGSIK